MPNPFRSPVLPADFMLPHGVVEYDFVVAGAGLAGSVCAERLANRYGKRVLVVEKRGHVGGNAWDYRDAHGILVHGFGPHIFHTRSDVVWDYLSLFTAWTFYEHRVLASIKGTLVPLPFNLAGIHSLFPPARAARLEAKLVGTCGSGGRITIRDLLKHPDEDLRELAAFVHENVFVNYTRKQWGLPIERLPSAVVGRVPVVAGWDDRYFADARQGMPESGYAALFERLLDSPLITVQLNADYRDIASSLGPHSLVYTGTIDSFFGHRHGRLPYRTLDFKLENHPVPSFQPAAVVNYPNDNALIRITEFKKLTGQIAGSTTVCYEYPRPCQAVTDEAYYPIPTEENTLLFNQYAKEARGRPDVSFVGRLAQYKYLDMDQVVSEALTTVDARMARDRPLT
jgi:UDP-galactopyranose mutase